MDLGRLHGHPGVPEDLGRGVSEVRVPDQQVTDQIPGLFGHRVPLVVREVVLSVLDAVEEQVLTGVAGLASFPAAVLAALPVERRVAAQHDVQDDTQAPQVAALVVGPGLVRPHVYYFRRHELG